MGVATYEGINVADKLPSVEELQKRIEQLEDIIEKEQNAEHCQKW